MSDHGAEPPRILVAGATGDLGGRIARALRARGAAVVAPIRRGTEAGRVLALRHQGIEPLALDLDDEAAMTGACEGAACIVSALNGLEHTIIGTQSVLLRAAVAAGVPRFIPSDFSLDFTRTTPGGNRNLDLRRAFHGLLDAAPIRATSILNGGFADMLAGEMPLILPRLGRVLYWNSPDQKLDFTAKDDVAAFTAEAALDDGTPRILRIAGSEASARDLARIATEVHGRAFTPTGLGGTRTLSAMIRAARILAPGKGQVFPPWQGLQYLRDMFSGQGKLTPLDNDRYPRLTWTTLREVLEGGR
ncbi:Nucleoside-diphosphate-sugar epimerase [Roseomonas rosea]|uniref:Nucleoside-diphosphate-sugar epimerase n=1 Tax=Muricoccus roseus TaxID=198092 RepID=A0A1M6BVR9_9PROT|nr:NmrA family NAD(P)-binding protein [Roseomonas rosea]SHI52849.1 Nucleoside-diphosphate-sugar epimerase [Roseomonas rosea]